MLDRGGLRVKKVEIHCLAPYWPKSRETSSLYDILVLYDIHYFLSHGCAEECKRMRGKSSPPVGGGCSSLMARSSDLCFLSLRRWQRWWWWWWWWWARSFSLSWARVWPEAIWGLSRSYSLRLTSRTPLWGVNEDVDRRMGLTSAIGCAAEINCVNMWKMKKGDKGQDTYLAQY